MNVIRHFGKNTSWLTGVETAYTYFQSKKSTAEELESIAEEVGGIEEFSRTTQVWHKKLIGYLLAYFSVLYLFCACVAYFRYLGHKDYQGCIQIQSNVRFI